MKAFLFLLIAFTSGTMLPAQQLAENLLPADPLFIPTVKTVFHQLGEKELPIRVRQYGTRNDLVFINLHDDETTSVEATQKILEKEGGLLIEIENEQQRFLSFRLGGNIYAVDPNRIFSVEGILKSLKERGRFSTKAVEEIGKLAARIIGFFPAEASVVIALHNNSPELFSAISYSPGHSLSKDAAKVYLDPKQDPDDFFFTTDQFLYEQLADRFYNIVLQDNLRCTEDGSLSVYCGKKNIRYVNCETEQGKLGQYYEMISSLFEVLSVPEK